jgi:hypothetical protein
MFNGNIAQRLERDAPEDLKQAFAVAIAFPTDVAGRLSFSKEALEKVTRLERAGAAHGEAAEEPDVPVPLLEPARRLMREWRKARAEFDYALQPALPEIRAAEKIQQEIADLAAKRERQKEGIRAQMQGERRHLQMRTRFDEAESRFRMLREENGNRDALLYTSSPFYWLILVCLGFAEWLINYDVFYLFVGIPAIAAGATILMAISLALAAHHFGKLFKQWTHRFGQQRKRAERLGDWRILALAAFLLVAVFACAAGSRWAAVMHQMNAQPVANILGADAAIDINPARDILLSLIWNVMAWAVGVIVSYAAHDADPEYMDASRQYQRAARAWHRFCRPFDEELRTLDARFAKDIAAREMAAQTQLQRVEPERKLYEQIEQHEAALVRNIVTAIRLAAPAYAGKIDADLVRRLDA